MPILLLASSAQVADARPLAVPTTSSASPHVAKQAREVAPGRRNELLGGGWQQSADRAWTLAGDADGLHIMVAEARAGYAWRTAASLSEPGFDTDRWLGNGCVTSSGRRLVVVYAPRAFTNKAELFDRGGFTAIVDLESGQVRKLPLLASLAYYNPGCGAGETAVLTQDGTEHSGKIRLLQVDAAQGVLSKPVDVPGQLTSPVPTKDGIVAADRDGLVRVLPDGKRMLLARSASTPFRVRSDAEGGVVFMDREGDRAFVRRAVPVPVPGRSVGRTRTETLASGPLTELGLTGSADGSVFITGRTDTVAPLPRAVRVLAEAKDTTVSTLGKLALTGIGRTGGVDPRSTEAVAVTGEIRIEAKVQATGKSLEFAVDPADSAGPDAAGRSPHPKLASSTPLQSRATGDPANPVEEERFCSVPRNDVANQAMQPKPRQVEWAANQAVRNSLHVLRPANWKNLGMPAYTPQGLFPPISLDGGGNVPAQVFLGILAQESNLWQAGRSALPGVTANPLIGNFHGRDIYNKKPNGEPLTEDDWDIVWERADCGYGVAQVTDGMRLKGKEKRGETALPYAQQRAVALDFAANIAAGLRILQDKWNQTRRAGMIIHEGEPQYLENWFFAIWAYNSGLHPDRGDGSPWGVGWGNNPVNPKYPANRSPFLENGYDDARVPNLWPYQEKVLGWAGHPIESVESPGKLIAGYRQAWWAGGPTAGVANRKAVKPPVNLFCDDSNWCKPGQKFTPDDPGEPGDPDSNVRGELAGPCAHKSIRDKYDLKCWYHKPASWKTDCASECGNELLRFDPGYAYQEDGNSYPPVCDRRGLPENAAIVDDVPHTTPSVRSDCDSTAWKSEGSFALEFAGDGKGMYPSKVDLHQIGAGFGGHFWFGHTRKPTDEGGKLRVSGTWTLNRPLHKWARVLIHLPDHGAHTQQAKYLIDQGNGRFDHARYLSQGVLANRWVSAGVYKFDGVPRVRLSTETKDGYGEEDIAFDAIAFQEMDEKPQHIVASIGDSYTSGEGAGDYSAESDANHGKPRWAACRRSANAWPRKLMLPRVSTSLGALSDGFSTQAELGFVACSGARTENVYSFEPGSWTNPAQYERGEGQFREFPQTESGVLTKHTTLVTLSIGGNDRDAFTNALVECSYPVPDCSKDETFLPRYKALIDSVGPQIEKIVRDVRQKAENAKILLVGYPEIFSRTVKCSGTLWFDGGETAALASLAAHLASVQSDLVNRLSSQDGIPIGFTSPVNEFVGHGACDDPEWINKFVLGPNGNGDFHSGDKPTKLCIPFSGGACLSRESFHPKRDGTSAYARVVQAALPRIGYL
ncbi:SGNH/GDSL hydrolase family protein [Crossiella sp. CA-258035]|uniref:SGNH/GDSL hydrolase family protein n=1 Tax=Crossiella sp. CA-258035 TaxID=2981138 RepID=UPI0024BC44E2|nr:SGNH/GDSL hydrolase family protein [Crossiella sp. CA-258035]WHT19450.1 SGNH/GDSL hydrolase family protein [Crossiella sp. CA-258035]